MILLPCDHECGQVGCVYGQEDHRECRPHAGHESKTAITKIKEQKSIKFINEREIIVTAVKTSKFGPRGNFALFLPKESLISKRVLYKKKLQRMEAKNQLRSANFVPFSSLLYQIHPKEQRTFQGKVRSFV